MEKVVTIMCWVVVVLLLLCCMYIQTSIQTEGGRGWVVDFGFGFIFAVRIVAPQSSSSNRSKMHRQIEMKARIDVGGMRAPNGPSSARPSGRTISGCQREWRKVGFDSTFSKENFNGWRELKFSDETRSISRWLGSTWDFGGRIHLRQLSHAHATQNHIEITFETVLAKMQKEKRKEKPKQMTVIWNWWIWFGRDSIYMRNFSIALVRCVYTARLPPFQSPFSQDVLRVSIWRGEDDSACSAMQVRRGWLAVANAMRCRTG